MFLPSVNTSLKHKVEQCVCSEHCHMKRQVGQPRAFGGFTSFYEFSEYQECSSLFLQIGSIGSVIGAFL